jgi:hypothetical protein
MTLPNLALLSATTPTGAAATVTYVGQTTSAADLSSYTFASTAIGVADADRTVVVSVASRKAGATTTITGVTVGGVSATELVQQANTITNTCVVGLYAIDVAAGTTATIVVTFGASMVRCGIGVYRCTGISTTPNDSGGTTTNGATVALDVTSGGAIIGVGTTATSTTYTWSGITETFEEAVGAELQTHSGAAAAFVSASTVNCSATAGSVLEPSMAFASW